MLRKEKNGIVWYEFEHLSATGMVNHCFSSRIGGVSKAPYASMNLAYHMGDNQADVDENFRLINGVVGFDDQQVVMAKQVHQADIQIVGKGDHAREGVDGLITAVVGPVLTTYYADCVPLLFLDPVQKVIANAHAGWRGTFLNIAGKTVQRLVDTFDCHARDILVGIGPCISMARFEVGPEVVDPFDQLLFQFRSHLERKNDQKWHIDLAGMNHQLLLEAGVCDAHLEVANLCTFENAKPFFSHRRDGTARGNMAAMIGLRSV